MTGDVKRSERAYRFRPGDRPLRDVDLELVRPLGMGGFGEVWLARNPSRPHLPPVVLKFCLDAEAARTLRREVSLLDRVAALGDHPGVVKLLDTYLAAETPCLEYEYVEGGDLAAWIGSGGRRASFRDRKMRRRSWRGSATPWRCSMAPARPSFTGI